MNKRTLFSALFVFFSQYSFADSISEFTGYVGVKSDQREPFFGKKFNDFMLKQKGKSVRVSIELDEVQNDDFSSSMKEPDKFNRTYLFVESNTPDSGEMRGAEYLIHLPKGNNRHQFIYNLEKATLSGCFNVFEIVGPRQMIMSVNLKPMTCEVPPNKSSHSAN